MNTSALINVIILIVILLITFYLVYRFDRKMDQLYFAMNRFTEDDQALLSGLSKFESCSISWVLGLVIYKYLICPWRQIDTDWFNRQILIGVILFFLIEIIDGVILYRVTHKK